MSLNRLEIQDAIALQDALERSFAYIEGNGIHTHDPFDVYGMPSIQRLMEKSGPVGAVEKKLLARATRFCPTLLRKVLRTPRKATAGGVAALAMAYTAVAGHENLVRARTHLEWLLRSGTRSGSYLGWGFPYAWKNEGATLPAGTPIGHTTMTCGNAFLRYYEATGESWVIEPLLEICHFFDAGLNKSQRRSGSIALSYTPADQSQIINVSADAASFLLRAAEASQHESSSRLAGKLLEFVLETQNDDGSWYYYAFDSIGCATMIDNRHTGMVLSALLESIPHLEGELQERAISAVEKGLGYFLDHLITREGLPKFFHNRTYPLEIYNFAQSIITLLDARSSNCISAPLRERSNAMVHRLVANLLRLMQKPDGGFLYTRDRFFKTNLNSLRWANALTTFALVRYRNEIHRSESQPVPLAATA